MEIISFLLASCFSSVNVTFSNFGSSFFLFLIHNQNLYFGIQRRPSLIDEARRSSFFLSCLALLFLPSWFLGL